MTTRSETSKAVTIFEGPDGAGKSTLAKEYAELTGARYVHHGPYKQVTDGLARLFVESMLPALLGYEDVVLDRCWLSEPIYADAFRQGNDRVGAARSRLLDRLALRCGAVVVKCLPPWAHVRACFVDRVADEYLDNEAQLLQVYGEYHHGLDTSLSTIEHDYTRYLQQSLSITAMELGGVVQHVRDGLGLHSLKAQSSGRWHAQVVVVGENFGAHKNNDPMYQAPFGSFNGNGCSLWLAEQLAEAEVDEQSVLWVNADELTPAWLDDHGDKRFLALGEQASMVLARYGVLNLQAFPHPQYWKRFQAGFQYPFIPALKETIHDVYSR